MIAYLQIALQNIKIIMAALKVAKEFIEYLNSTERSHIDKAEAGKIFATSIATARKKGNTDEIERIFGQPANSSVNELQDKKDL